MRPMPYAGNARLGAQDAALGMAKLVSVSGLGTFKSTTDAAEAIGVSVYRLRGALKRNKAIEGYEVKYA